MLFFLTVAATVRKNSMPGLYQGFMEIKVVKIVVFVPVSHADDVRQALHEAGAGKIGNYEYCSFSVSGKGRFRPMEGAKPFIGKQGVIEEVDEERIEVICPYEKWQGVVEAVSKVHPYEEPAIDVVPLLNF